MIIKPRKYANGGKVASKFQKTRAPRGTTSAPKPASAADAMMNQRARQMKALGLRDGGRVKIPSSETRKVPTTQLPAPQTGAKPKRIGKR